MTKLDALGHVGKQTFQVDEALYVKNCEVVFQPHVVEVLLDALGFLITEEANSEGLESSLGGQSLFSKFHIFFDGKRLA